jgi:hypothetical protein
MNNGRQLSSQMTNPKTTTYILNHNIYPKTTIHGCKKDCIFGKENGLVNSTYCINDVTE